MILTCPECASRYFVDDSKVGAAGRVVRCASCGHRWTARNEEPVDLFEDPSSTATASEAAMTALDANGAASDPTSGGSASAEEDPSLSVVSADDEPSKPSKARSDARRRMRETAITAIVWAGAAAAMAAVVVAALIFRIDVTRLWPATAGAYAAVGLPVNTVGLVIENIKAEPSLENGHAAVTITGVMRNITERVVVAPPLHIELRNAKDKRVAGRLATAVDPRIPPNQVRHFSITLVDPPRTAKDLVIDFAGAPGSAHAEKTALKPSVTHGTEAQPSLRGAQEAAAKGEAAGHEPSGHETGAAQAPPTDSHEPAHHE